MSQSYYFLTFPALRHPSVSLASSYYSYYLDEWHLFSLYPFCQIPWVEVLRELRSHWSTRLLINNKSPFLTFVLIEMQFIIFSVTSVRWHTWNLCSCQGRYLVGWAHERRCFNCTSIQSGIVCWLTKYFLEETVSDSRDSKLIVDLSTLYYYSSHFQV